MTSTPAWAAGKKTHHHSRHKAHSKTHSKTAHKSHKKKTPHKKTHAKLRGHTKSDAEARVLLRKRAPFYLDERHRSEVLRINRDGTFSRSGHTNKYSPDGHWKVRRAKLVLKWNTGENYGYPVRFSGRRVLISNARVNSQGRYVIRSAE
jgi:hypothetical protein